MGTRGILYIYLIHKNIRFLVYATYSQYDGFDWIQGANAKLSELLATKNWRLADLLDAYGTDYKFDGWFASDAEAISHRYLIMADETANVNLDLATVRYEPKNVSSYGFNETGTYGDCMVRPDDDDCYEMIPEFNSVMVCEMP